MVSESTKELWSSYMEEEEDIPWNRGRSQRYVTIKVGKRNRKLKRKREDLIRIKCFPINSSGWHESLEQSNEDKMSSDKVVVDVPLDIPASGTTTDGKSNLNTKSSKNNRNSTIKNHPRISIPAKRLNDKVGSTISNSRSPLGNSSDVGYHSKMPENKERVPESEPDNLPMCTKLVAEENNFEAFGKHMAAKLKYLEVHARLQRILAEKMINEILLEAELGALSTETRLTSRDQRRNPKFFR